MPLLSGWKQALSHAMTSTMATCTHCEYFVELVYLWSSHEECLVEKQLSKDATHWPHIHCCRVFLHNNKLTRRTIEVCFVEIGMRNYLWIEYTTSYRTHYTLVIQKCWNWINRTRAKRCFGTPHTLHTQHTTHTHTPHMECTFTPRSSSGERYHRVTTTGV